MKSNFGELSRRSLLAGTALLGTTTTVPAADTAADVSAASPGSKRRVESQNIRIKAAKSFDGMPIPAHPTNGDEDSLKMGGKPTYIGNYTKGMPHNEFGEVAPAAYQKLLEALETGSNATFEEIPLGGGGPVGPALISGVLATHLVPEAGERFYRLHSEAALVGTGVPQLRFIDPQAASAFDLEGADSHEWTMPPPPSFSSSAIITEMAENYWLALCRDVPFASYTNDPTVKGAVANLNTFASYAGPGGDGGITVDNVFRGGTSGDLIGPYVSQFLLIDIPFGVFQLPQKAVFGFEPNSNGEREFMIDESDWLARQRGMATKESPTAVKDPSYIYRGRDLANFVHIDELFQAYLNAALILGAPPSRGGLGAPHNVGNPYDGYLRGTTPVMIKASHQLGFGTLGEPNIKSLVAEVSTRALKAVWFQKWSVHRRLRPEVFGGRVHFQKSNKRSYPFHPDFAKLDEVLNAVAKSNGQKGGSGWFLPMAFPEGSPLHPSYGAGHATVAGACATVLKAYYDPTVTFAQLNAPIYVPLPSGKGLFNLRTDGPYGNYDYQMLADKMTVGGEIEKIASNVSIGRNFAGVHWRWDHRESLKLGEAVAVQFLKETASTYHEKIRFVFTSFDGRTQYDFGN